MNRLLSLIVLIASATTAYADTQILGYKRYNTPNLQMSLPKNNLHLQDRANIVANITESRFNEIIDDAMAYWYPIAKAKGVELTVEKKWNDPTVNAFASQSGNKWMVAMFGGLARRPEVTEDGFAMVVCHELGHHFGGYSFKGESWASSEGESDYFAANACAKRIWGHEHSENMKSIRLNDIPKKVIESCTAAWPNNEKSQAWCIRTSAAGFSLAHLLAVLGGDPVPSFDNPDKTVVPKTSGNHPRAQCRLDTYFAGALCTKKFDLNVIPAKAHPKGQGSPEAEMEARKHTCFSADNFQMGARPLCWFKPLTNQKAL